MKILFDSDAFIGLANRKDALHQNCLDLLHQLDHYPHRSLFTSWDVISESTTKITYYLGKAHARKFFSLLSGLDIQRIYSSEKITGKTITLFNSIPSKRVSLTDCNNIVIAKELHLDTIFSFDHIYPQHGLKLLSQIIK